MFQASRQLFRRSSAGRPASASSSPAASEETSSTTDRHPAMRGLNVSPVHGRHCICERCEQHKHAA